MGIRWRKVWRDLWANKTRTMLVLLSISVGVTAIGMVMGAQVIVDQSLPAAYASVNPSDGLIFCISTFDDDMIELEADPSDPDDVTDLQTDDEFMLTPVAGDGDLDEFRQAFAIAHHLMGL